MRSAWLLVAVLATMQFVLLLLWNKPSIHKYMSALPAGKHSMMKIYDAHLVLGKSIYQTEPLFGAAVPT